MQVLSDTTIIRDVSPQQCAEEILDGVPEVMWMLRCHMRAPAEGLSVPQFRALCMVNKSNKASMSMVAEQLGSTLPTASRLVAGLVTRGLVRCKASVNDRRQVQLNLTAKGKSILDFARQGTQAAVANKLLGMSAEDRATISSAMALMVGVLGRNPCESGSDSTTER